MHFCRPPGVLNNGRANLPLTAWEAVFASYRRRRPHQKRRGSPGTPTVSRLSHESQLANECGRTGCRWGGRRRSARCFFFTYKIRFFFSHKNLDLGSGHLAGHLGSGHLGSATLVPRLISAYLPGTIWPPYFWTRRVISQDKVCRLLAPSSPGPYLPTLAIRAFSTSSPFSHCTGLGWLAASHPSA